MKHILRLFIFLPLLGYGQISLEDFRIIDTVRTITLSEVTNPGISFNQGNCLIRVNKEVLLTRIELAIDQTEGSRRSLNSRLFNYISELDTVDYDNFWEAIEEPISIYEIKDDKELGRRLLPELMSQIINDGLIELKIHNRTMKEVIRTTGTYKSAVVTDIVSIMSIFSTFDGDPIWICLADAIR